MIMRARVTLRAEYPAPKTGQMKKGQYSLFRNCITKWCNVNQMRKTVLNSEETA